jgi:hypothetical protein
MGLEDEMLMQVFDGVLARAAVVGAAVLAVLFGPRTVFAESRERSPAKTVAPKGWMVEDEVTGDLGGVVGHASMLVSTGTDGGERNRLLLVSIDGKDGVRKVIGRSEGLLLCAECFGALGGAPRLSIERSVLIVKQERGSRHTVEGTWRFRREKGTGRMRLIGLDLREVDTRTGAGSTESTNYLTGARITEVLAYDPAKKEIVPTQSEASTVTVPTVYLEDASASSLDKMDEVKSVGEVAEDESE